MVDANMNNISELPVKSRESVKDRIRSFVQRIERLEAEKAELAEDIKEIYAEAKGAGYDTKAMKAVIRERKKDPQEREEQLSLFDVYWDAAHG